MNVACLFIPEFPVALARRDNPRLRGRPVIIGGSPGEQAQVTACSQEAVKAGVAIGMTLPRALSLCPGAVFLPLQESSIAAEAEAILDVLCRHSPVIEAIAPGHAHVDIRGLERLAGVTAEAYLRDLYEAVRLTCRLPVHLAAADSVFTAHAGAIAIAGPAIGALLVSGESAGAFLAPLPVEVLPVPAAMHQRLRLLGLERLGQVAELPFSAMQAQFGRDGARAWELARGRDDSVVVPQALEVRVTGEVELPAPSALSEPLVVATRALLLRALERPEVRGHSLRRLDWRLGLENGETVARRFVFREPTADAARMLFVVKGKIERLQLAAAAVSVGVTLSGLCSEYGHQANLWPIGPRRQKELAEAIEQLNARAGEPQVYRIVEVQPWSRIPERQQALVAYRP
ncbi:MAG: hypothetical protein KJ053_12225 [Dehalococcoidia bacterium]|nr:hypothetical protein [Dehalococcoidia bacterium]